MSAELRSVETGERQPKELLRVASLTKRFRGVVANDGLDLEIQAGEIHAILGENGAGKSTLVNILGGLLTPDEGVITWEGRKVILSSPRVSADLGIGMVHQHFMLVPRLTVLENVTLGMSRAARGSKTESERRLRELAAEFQTEIDLHRPVDTLSVGERQKVEILKALFRKVRLLILDEPTATLAPHESQQLFRIGRSIAARGGSVIFITHRLEEVVAFSHRVTVLRSGRNAGTFATSRTTPWELACLMVGHEVATPTTKHRSEPGDRLLEVAGLSTLGTEGEVALEDVSFDIRRGEIVGIAGVDGNGQTELVETLLGLRRPRAGRILLEAEDIASLDTEAILAKGVAVVPGDRHAAAMIEDFDLPSNSLLGLGPAIPWVTHGWLDWTEIGRTAAGIVEDYKVKTRALGMPIGRLSGGHQQRFVLGRALRKEPKLLVAAQPTRGLDLESAAMVRAKMLELRSSGRGALLLSMDLDELLMLSDRIAVLFGGRIIGWTSGDANRAEIGLLMAGIFPEKPSASP